MNKLYIISILLFFNCNSNNNKTESNTIFKKKQEKFHNVKIDTSGIINNFNKELFDFSAYKFAVDSILKSLNKNYDITTKIDTIKDGDFLNVSFKGTCFEKINNETELITKYSFSIKDGGKRMYHSVIIFEFDSIKKLEKNYDCLKTEALNTPAPGLSYSNDYVTFINNKIYWLNSSCMFSYSNHNKFVDVFKKSIRLVETTSIQCECGHVICEFSDK